MGFKKKAGTAMKVRVKEAVIWQLLGPEKDGGERARWPGLAKVPDQISAVGKRAARALQGLGLHPRRRGWRWRKYNRQRLC